MKYSIEPKPKAGSRRSARDAGRSSDGLMAQALGGQLASLREGRITLADGERTESYGGRGAPSLSAAVTVHDRRFYRDVVFGGSLGAAESYIRGRWSCSDLTTLCRIFARNLNLSDGMEKGWARLPATAAKLFHWLHRNTRSGSARNIGAHYDLGNDFYQLFLDETMTYSCGIFEEESSTLEEASIAKLDRMCQKLDLRPDDHVLEIGTGWGGWAIHAAGRYGCRVTSTTISKEQYSWAVDRVRRQGLENRVEILLRDYRDLEGLYDKAVSIEMIEAVGHEFLGDYFAKVSSLLKPDGLFALQGITVTDRRYEQYRRGVDFIQRFVFPGSCLTSVSAMFRAAAERSDMQPIHFEDIAPHYARTLLEWRRRFLANLHRVRELGYSEEFIRLWEYYLCYCEAGFLERHVGNAQLVLAKPRNRREPIAPMFDSALGKRSTTAA